MQKLTTSLLGTIEVSLEDGYCEDITAMLNGREIEFCLYIFEDYLNKETAELTESFLENIPLMQRKAKAEILENADSELISFFVECHLESLEPEPLQNMFSVEKVSEITNEDFLTALELVGMQIGPNEEGTLLCNMDFSPDEVYTNTQLQRFF
jgi:hypothetical protein